MLTISLPHPHTSPTHSGPSPQKYLSYFSSSWLRSTLPLPAGPFLNYTRKCLWKGRIKGDWLRSLTRAPAEPSKVRLPPAPLCRKWGWEFRRRARSGGLGAGAGNPWGFSERSVLSPGGRELSPPSQDPLQKRLPPRHAGTTRPSSGPQPCLSGDSRSPHPHQPAHRHVSPSPRPPPPPRSPVRARAPTHVGARRARLARSSWLARFSSRTLSREGARPGKRKMQSWDSWDSRGCKPRLKERSEERMHWWTYRRARGTLWTSVTLER